MGETPRLWYANVFVTDLERAVRFYRDTLGLELQFSDTDHGYASFDAGPIRLGVARIDPQDPRMAALCGRQTGIGFGVDDLTGTHATLRERGVEFSLEPEKQPWGGFMAMFADPDGNVFYLDQRGEP